MKNAKNIRDFKRGVYSPISIFLKIIAPEHVEFIMKNITGI